MWRNRRQGRLAVTCSGRICARLTKTLSNGINPTSQNAKSEADREKEREKDLYDRKDLAFYSACLGAWIQTTMERDKTLIILSSAGIGLLVTLISRFPFDSYWIQAYLALSFACFMICEITCISILKNNAKFIETYLQESKRGNNENCHKMQIKLRNYDRVAGIAFTCGLFFMIIFSVLSSTLVIGTSSDNKQFPKRRDQMNDQAKSASSKGQVAKSMQGITNLEPARSQSDGHENRSFVNIVDLAPQPPPASSQANPSTGSTSDAGSTTSSKDGK